MSSQDNNVNGVPVRLKLLHRRDLVPCCLIDIRLLQACGNALFQNGVARQTFGFSGCVVFFPFFRLSFRLRRTCPP